MMSLERYLQLANSGCRNGELPNGGGALRYQLNFLCLVVRVLRL